GNEGKIIEVTTNRPIHLNVLERGRETGPRYEYHQAYTDGRYIYDPRAHLGPIPRGDWTRMIEKLNPEGVSFRDVNL
ncbi:MAG: hypothetical protein ABIQ95_07835, partial [Bdellovibrionia bacterium]